MYNLYVKRRKNAEGDRVKLPPFRDITATVKVEMLQEWQVKHRAIYLRLITVLGEEAPLDGGGNN